MLRTRLCELLSIEIPVVGAPLGPEIASLELAAAISNAGGLGMISFGGYAPVALKERIRKLRTLTSKPFGVNVLLGGPHLPLPEDAFVDACLDERVPVLSFFWGDCTLYVERAHKLAIKVCDQVGSGSAAKRAERAGVDFIIAQGVEAGGHVAGTVGSMVLVPRIADSVAPVPVVAAGGIADGRGLAAALALGAQGVVLGTRLLAATECNTHEVYRKKILAASEEDTVRTTLFGNEWPNAPHRTLRTPFVERWLSQEKRGSEQRADEPIVGEISFGGNRVPLRRFGGIPPARKENNMKNTSATLKAFKRGTSLERSKWYMGMLLTNRAEAHVPLAHDGIHRASIARFRQQLEQTLQPPSEPFVGAKGAVHRLSSETRSSFECVSSPCLW